MDQFLQDLDEDVEGMQSTIYFLQNELLKYKTSAQNTSDAKNKETITKESINDNNKDDVITAEPIPSVSNSETPTKFDRIYQDLKSYKTYSSVDLKDLKDCTSSSSKVKELKLFVGDDVNQCGKSHRVHNCKHRSDGSKSEKKRKKSEKRHCSKDKGYHKKSKSDLSKITNVYTNVEAVNRLQNVP